MNRIEEVKVFISNIWVGSTFKKGIINTFLYSIYLNFIAFFSSFLTAKYLGPRGRGEIGLIFIYTQMAWWLAGLGLSRGHIYYLNHKKDANLVQKIFTHSVLFSILAGIPTAVILTRFIEDMLKGSEILVVNMAKLYIGSIPLMMLSDQIMNIFLGLRRYLLFNLKRAILPTLYALIIIALLFTNHLNVSNLLLIQVLNIAIELIVVTLLLNYHFKLRILFDIKLFKDSLSFGLKSYPNDLAETGNQQIDQLFVAPWLGPRNFGLYVVARSFSGIINILSSSIYSIIFPEVSNRGNLNGKTLIKKALLYSVPILFLAYLFLLFIIPEIIKLLLGDDYFESIIIAKLLLLGLLFFGLAQIIQYGFYGLGRQLESGVINWLSLIVCVLLLIWLIPLYSLQGAAYAFIGGCFMKLTMYLYRYLKG